MNAIKTRTKKEFFELAEFHAISVDWERGTWDEIWNDPIPFRITLVAPKGMVFRGTETHCDCSIKGDEGTTATCWTRAYAELEEIINKGFELCEDSECDICKD